MILSVISKKIRQYPVLVVSALLVVLCGVLIFMRGPKIQRFETRLSDLEKEWDSIQTNMERSAGLESDIAGLEDGLERLNSRLMNVEEVASNYEFFYDLERSSGVSIQQFAQGVPSNGQGLKIGKEKMDSFSALPFDVGMRGTLKQILTFMDQLDRQDYIVRFELLQVAVPTDALNEVSGETQLVANMRCYVLASKND